MIFSGPTRAETLLAAGPDKRPVFDFGIFQEEDGAVPLIQGRNRIDAYFVTKALLTANDAGLDIQDAGTKWVKWLLPRQKPDGRFERYKRERIAGTGKSNWKAVANADADDALMALWIELLYVLAPKEGLPQDWKRSVWLAGDHLATLKDERGIYVISNDLRVGLLMDNVEVYGALIGTARERVRLGHLSQALSTALRAGQLSSAIDKVFWNGKLHRFSVSTQNIPDEQFYPHAVAQIYPLLYGLRTPTGEDQKIYNAWLTKYGSDWLYMKRDEFPWGLVAFLAWKQGDTNTALAWKVQNEPFRYSVRWTVLDEAVLQSLEGRLPADKTTPTPDPRLQAPQGADPTKIAP